MTAFALGAAALLALAAALLSPAWRHPAAQAAAGRSSRVPRLLRDQLESLDRELAEGRLDTAQHHAARLEVQRRLLDEAGAEPGASQRAARPAGGAATAATGVLGAIPPLARLVALAVPAFAIAVYAALGNPAALQVSNEPAPAVTAGSLADMLERMAAGLSSRPAQPDDVSGWTVIARSYASMQRFDAARQAYDRALALAPADAQLLADQADVIAMLQGGATAGEPARLIDRALAADPRNAKAQALAGTAAFERRDAAAALAHWRSARALAEPGSEFAAGLDRNIAEARQRLGASPLLADGGAAGAGAGSLGNTTANNTTGNARGAAFGEAGGPAVAPSPAATTTPSAEVAATLPAGAARITGRVELAAGVRDRVAPGDTVFVYARAAEGPRMPLAILRRTVADLPLDFTLDDSLAMSPAMKLSGAERVVVTARISRSGSAMAQPGDLTAESAVVAPNRTGLVLRIEAASADSASVR